jgi:replicative DNA helicase
MARTNRGDREEKRVPAVMEADGVERELIGAIINSPSLIWGVLGKLRADEFGRAAHQQIFGVMLDLGMQNRVPTHTLVASRLPEESEDDSVVFFPSYLAALAGDVEDSPDIGALIDTIRQVAQRRRIKRLADDLQKDATNGAMSTLEILNRVQVQLSDLAGSESGAQLVRLGDVAKDVMEQSLRSHNSGVSPGYTAPLASITRIIGEVYRGDLVSIMAAQGEGKTLLALQWADHLSRVHDMPSAFFQGEMSKEQMAVRELAAASGISVGRIMTGRYNQFAEAESLVEAGMKTLQRPDIFLCAKRRISLQDIRLMALAGKRRHNIGAIFVDHLRIIETGKRGQNEFQRMADVTMELKALAGELDIIVFLLCQRTRFGQRRDDARPQLDDAPSGTVEQDSDIVLALWRAYKWMKKQKPDARGGDTAKYEWDRKVEAMKGVAEAAGLKVRQGAADEDCRFLFSGERMRFSDYSSQADAPPAFNFDEVDRPTG